MFLESYHHTENRRINCQRASVQMNVHMFITSVDSDSIGDKQKEVVNGKVISEEKERYSRGLPISSILQ